LLLNRMQARPMAITARLVRSFNREKVAGMRAQPAGCARRRDFGAKNALRRERESGHCRRAPSGGSTQAFSAVGVTDGLSLKEQSSQ
jgi:hypothetical protein